MKKKLVALILAAALLICAAVPALAAYDLNEAKKSVVRIAVEFTVLDPRAVDYGVQYVATGSGFAIGKLEDTQVEYIVTAAHVVNRYPDSGNMGITSEWTTLKDGTEAYVEVSVDRIMVLLGDRSLYVNAQYVACLGPSTDVALIRLNTPISDRRPAVLSDRTDFAINEPLTTMGFPRASEANLTTDAYYDYISDTKSVAVNQGTFSTLDRHATTQQGDMITTNAMMDAGISGGPLLDNDGYVVGVCVGTLKNNKNINYAVTAGEVIKLLGTISDATYELGPIHEGLSVTMIIIIAAAAVLIIVLILLIIFSSRNKKNARSMVFGGVMAGKTIQLKKGTPVVVGRDPSRCQVVYPKDTNGVSSVHCTITFDGNQVLVADNGSSYGTFVGGQKVEPGRPVVMHRGQEVTFGSEKNSAELH